MYIKMIGSICILSACIGIGNYYIELYRDRVRLLKEFRTMAILWKGGIRYGNDNMINLIESISTKLDVRIQKFLMFVVEEMNKMKGSTFEDIWKDAIEKLLKNRCLKDSDLNVTQKFGSILGCFDKELQIESCNQYIQDMNNLIEGIEIELKDRIKVCRTLSLMIGVCVVIIFIN